MGLDMYLFKTKKAEGFGVEKYNRIARVVSEAVSEEADLKGLDLEKRTGIAGANALLPAITRRGDDRFYWYSLFEEIGYWRKANHIHHWFVQNVQNGVDECELSLVSQEQLQALLETTKEAKKNTEKAGLLLPTQGGFFFGSTEHDEYYLQQIDQTNRIIRETLAKTDFSNEIVFYQSSW